MRAYLYIARCRDGSCCVGTRRGSLETRISQHNTGHFGGYTSTRRPVVLASQQDFGRIAHEIAAERQVKGWRRAKKEAPIHGEFDALRELSMRYTPFEKAPA